MPKSSLPYSKTGFFSKLICDYLNEDESLSEFYGNYPSLLNFKDQIEQKSKNFDPTIRKIIVENIREQYDGFQISESTQRNLEKLQEPTTFTITTGHQLNLFTGPLYFLYKILDTINLCEKLRAVYPTHNFVPVYWMATEDHDFEEINYFHFKENKIQWNRESSGAVGELKTDGLNNLFEQLKTIIDKTERGQELLNLFEKSYVEHDQLDKATRYLTNELFSEYGLLILDGNNKQLKNHFIPYARLEILENTSYKAVTETTTRLQELGYEEQVHPREINLFYLHNNLRGRIIERQGKFYIDGSELVFSKNELLEELENYPERFSPNALLRPLYQEVILPNLCYIGGAGELAYWFQLKNYFSSVDVTYPILILRNSVLLVTKKNYRKLEKLNVDIEDLFLDSSELSKKFIKRISEVEIDFTDQKNHLIKQFKDLYELAKQTDASFVGAVAAQEKKQLNGLSHLEKRLLNAQKRKLKEQLDRLLAIKNELFINGNLQERHLNFSSFYLSHGEQLLNVLKSELDPLNHEFTILEI